MTFTQDQINEANLARALDAAHRRANTIKLGTRLAVSMEKFEREEHGWCIFLKRQDGVRVEVHSEDVDPTDEAEVKKWLAAAKKAKNVGRMNTH